jgi:hypothetical protein
MCINLKFNLKKQTREDIIAADALAERLNNIYM